MQTEWVVMPNSSHIHLGKTYLFIILCPLRRTFREMKFLDTICPFFSPTISQPTHLMFFLEKCSTLQFKGNCKIPTVEKLNYRCTITLLYLEHYKHSRVQQSLFRITINCMYPQYLQYYALINIPSYIHLLSS